MREPGLFAATTATAPGVLSVRPAEVLGTARSPLPIETLQIGLGWFGEDASGLNRYFADLMHALPTAGVNVNGLVVGSPDVTRDSKGAVRAFAEPGRSLIHRLKRSRSEVRRSLTSRPTALLVSHFALYTAPCLDFIRDRSLVVHFHGPWASESRVEGSNGFISAAKHRLESAVYSRADRLIVLSRSFGTILEEQYAINGERICVVPGGVDTSRFAPDRSKSDARRQLGWASDRPIVLAVRRLVRRVGLEQLIDAIDDVRRQVPDVLLMIGGQGRLHDELQSRIRARNLDAHVRLIGFIDDRTLPVAYRAADISLVPSVALEGFGLTVGESLASGTPVLVTNVGGLPETIEDLAPQCVIQGATAKAIAVALSDALRGHLALPAERQCIEFAQSQLDWGHVAARLRDIYVDHS